MMKAMQFKYKSTEVKMVEIDHPTVAPKQLLIKVHFAALDTGTEAVLQRNWMGMFIHARAKKNGSSLVLGWHYCGEIVQRGAEVSDDALKQQEMVWGFLQYEPTQTQGSFAEYIVVGADECAPIPTGIPVETVTAASTESLTALQAIRNLGNLSTGKSILVLGAGGGVGTAAVQIAKNLGAHVTASCSSKDMQRVKDLGADMVLDRRESDPFSHTEMYDVIFDTPNMYSAVKSLRRLKPKGTYVVTMPTGSLFAAMFLSLLNRKKAKFVSCRSTREDLELVGEWMKQGRLKVDVDSVFAIHEIEKALIRQSNKSKLGRIVLQVKDGWKQ